LQAVFSMLQIDLRNKRAVVCGSTQGIGKATAMLMAEAGATVILIARNPEKLAAVKAALPTPYGQPHETIVADFANPNILKVKLDNYLQKTSPVHILVNNTGGPPAGKAIDSGVEQFLAAFQAHLVCNHILVQTVADGMKRAGYGRIINIISTSVKQPIPGLGVSNTIRGAVGNWAKTLAGELAPFGITVNNILPGATSTERLSAIIENKSEKTNKDKGAVESEMLHEIPAGRFADPKEIGYAATFLASPMAAYINGTNVVVDGGRTASL
jgi:3-oxoacyl-[acyl-carrier protein] reductase